MLVTSLIGNSVEAEAVSATVSADEIERPLFVNPGMSVD